MLQQFLLYEFPLHQFPLYQFPLLQHFPLHQIPFYLHRAGQQEAVSVRPHLFKLVEQTI